MYMFLYYPVYPTPSKRRASAVFGQGNLQGSTQGSRTGLPCKNITLQGSTPPQGYPALLPCHFKNSFNSSGTATKDAPLLFLRLPPFIFRMIADAEMV